MGEELSIITAVLSEIDMGIASDLEYQAYDPTESKHVVTDSSDSS